MEIKRTPAGQFVKGSSGNLAGRPRTDQTVRDLARTKTDEAIQILFAIAANPMASDAARVQACNSLLDRGWGRPVQTNQNMNVTGTYVDFLMDLAKKEGMTGEAIENESEEDLLS